jgi:hypothetical protein
VEVAALPRTPRWRSLRCWGLAGEGRCAPGDLPVKVAALPGTPRWRSLSFRGLPGGGRCAAGDSLVKVAALPGTPRWRSLRSRGLPGGGRCAPGDSRGEVAALPGTSRWRSLSSRFLVAGLDTTKKVSGQSGENPQRTGPPGPPTWPQTLGRKRPSLGAVLKSGGPPESPSFVFASTSLKPTEGMHTGDTDLAASKWPTPLRSSSHRPPSTREGFGSISATACERMASRKHQKWR